MLGSGFWLEEANALDWFRAPTVAGRWDFEAADFSWYEDGALNACHNCVDRWAESQRVFLRTCWSVLLT